MRKRCREDVKAAAMVAQHEALRRCGGTILLKTQMYALCHAGHFANRLIAWDSVDEWLASGYNKPVVFRSKRLSGGAITVYGILPHQAKEALVRFERSGVDRSRIVVNELGSVDRIVFQGEAMLDAGGLYLRYSTVLGKPMIVALREETRHASGLTATMLARGYMDAPSCEWLMELLDSYADSVVEFTTYSCGVGCFGWNTVFWEVRNY